MTRAGPPSAARHCAWVLAVVLLLPLATACAQTHLDCDPAVSLDGRTYRPWAAWAEKGEPPTGETVGTAMAPATFADPEADTCDLTAPFTALAVEGVDPAVAFFAPDSPGGLYVSAHVGDVSQMPPALRRLVRDPQ